MKLTIGTLVTVVGASGQLVQATVWGREFKGQFHWRGIYSIPSVAPVHPDGFADYEAEGAAWVRGHVTEADEAGRALLAAHALRADSHGYEYTSGILFDFMRKTYKRMAPITAPSPNPTRRTP